MITTPSRDTKKYIQANRGNILGNLWSTFGIDLLDNPGALRLGQRMKIATKTGDANASNLGIPVGFSAFGDRIVCLAGTRAFISGASYQPTLAFVEDTSTGARTDWSSDTDDLLPFNGVLVGCNATQSKLYTLDTSSGGTWTARASSSFSTAGLLDYFKKFNRLYILNYGGSSINSVDTSWAVASAGTSNYTLKFTGNDDNGSPRCMAAGSDRIWIGMARISAGGAADNSNPKDTCSIYEWDGISNQVTKEYKIPAQGVMAMVIRNDVPIIMDSEGVLREFNGSAFKEIGRLPLRRNDKLAFTAAPGWVSNFIHPKGLTITKDNTILAFICNRTAFDFSSANRLYENIPSGIWEFDGAGSAVHKHPFTYMGISSTSVTDYGQNRLVAVGSIANIDLVQQPSAGISSILAGAQYYTDASSTNKAVFIDAPQPTDLVATPEGQKAGYYVTNWNFSQNLKDTWQKLWLKYRQFLASNDKIVVKYRTRDTAPIEISITWVNTTSFTTTTDLSAASFVGYEIEVLQGTGSGKCVHISSVSSYSGGVCTVTVDDTVTGVTTGTAKARYQNWKKAFTIQNQTDESTIKTITNVSSERIQIKVYAEFTGDNEIYELGILNSVQQAIG